MPSGITPALTEASKSVEVVKLESDTMVAKRTSDDWPTLELRTLRFNALLSRSFAESVRYPFFTPSLVEYSNHD